MSAYYFFASGPKLPFSSSNAGVIADDQTCFRFSICQSASQIFAVKVKCCPKSCQILNVFALQFLAVPQKVYPNVICLPRGTSRGKVSWGFSP